jgi:hypothetical protein
MCGKEVYFFRGDAREPGIGYTRIPKSVIA